MHRSPGEAVAIIAAAPARTGLPSYARQKDTTMMAPAWAIRYRPLRRLGFEFALSWSFNRSDLPAGTIPGLIVTYAAWTAHAQPASNLPWSLARALLYFWLFLSIHTLSNQATGYTEDQVNKPWRPIPSGMVSVVGAHQRFGVLAVVFLSCGWLFGVFWWALSWTALVVAHNYLGSDRHWLTKNLHTFLGSFTSTAAAWQMIAPITPYGWRWIIAATCYWGLVFIQDLRDIAGDAAAGRQTLPMVLGERQTRILLATGLILFPVLAHLLLGAPQRLLLSVIWEILLSGTAACTAARVIRLRTPRSDHITYQLYCWLWCWLLLGPAFTHG
ncbi:UbiA family prenyltransferase [Streptomyces wuyuanensis]|uniref:UbiA family prenyltransferase n=1 Tax=Streptomyces wuyuanensis TaxID=1196353 RepID=UPI003419B296